MTLKEKLEQHIDPQIDVIHLEQIADDYAIEFAEWVNINFFVYNTWEERKSIKQLLEIFKKEKGL